jgi:glutamyl-tRNA synthetase
LEKTRLAPSPTGALHLGNIRTFLVTWAMARRAGWTILLRIEDLDGPRVKPGAGERVIDTLSWLGMDWDEGPLTQSHNVRPYADAMERLASVGLVYPCDLTRREIELAASAPHAEEQEVAFPTSLRPAQRPDRFDDPEASWRFVVDSAPIRFTDAFHRVVCVDVGRQVGDFVVWTKRGQPAYQLAVVVDDARQGVTQVVRGDDLLDSTGRQLLLQRALGLEPAPAYTHLPLVVGPDGRRLAKRHGDTRIESYREAGVPAGRLIALIGRCCGLEGATSMSSDEFAAGLDLARIPREPMVMTPEDDRWLKASAGV